MILVRTDAIGDVLLIESNNPPINAGSLGVREGLMTAIEQLAPNPALRAGVLIDSGSTFVADSDLREFGQPLQEPQVPCVLAAIEACAKPVVASLRGAGWWLGAGPGLRRAHRTGRHRAGPARGHARHHPRRGRYAAPAAPHGPGPRNPNGLHR